jgi:hypothetical protein
MSLVFSPGYGQETDQKSSIINFFLDCFHCDFNYVRQELPFISFVRESQLADVHILMSESETGSGGNKFFLNFIGLKSFKGMDFEYTIITKQSDTEDDVRKALLKLIKIGVLSYYSKTSFIDQLDIDLASSDEKTADEMVIDRWNKWVFRLETGGELQLEQQQNQYLLDSEVSAEKITEKWKTAIEAQYEISRENYYDNDSLISDKQNSKNITAEYVKSLTDKWSAGIFADYSSSTFLNTEHKYGIAAGIEYNIFPWKECNRRVFTIRYGVGLYGYNYFEETIYDKMKETLWGESLLLNLQLIQKWGEARIGLEGSNFFHDFSKNRMTFVSDVSVRLSKNFSVFCQMRSAAIHDQLYLAKGHESLDDILLRRHKLATTYELNGELGFRFTFGSIYNNVVNERFYQ